MLNTYTMMSATNVHSTIFLSWIFTQLETKWIYSIFNMLVEYLLWIFWYFIKFWCDCTLIFKCKNHLWSPLLFYQFLWKIRKLDQKKAFLQKINNITVLVRVIGSRICKKNGGWKKFKCHNPEPLWNLSFNMNFNK